MPWIDREKCVGCGICVKECPVDTIKMEDKKAYVDMDGCIHCGICYRVCIMDAIRHNSEKTPSRIKQNVSETKKFMDDCEKHLGKEKERKKCLDRVEEHFKNEKLIIDKTLEELTALN